VTTPTLAATPLIMIDAVQALYMCLDAWP